LSRAARLIVFSVPAAACAVWTVCAGKDLNWDLLNYHYYLPFELIAGRLGQDFFAASAQSYLNPVGYLPFYLMVSSGWHSVLASIMLALVHSLSLAFVYLLAWRLFAHLPARERIVFACLATATGAATAVYWATVGTSFLDPLLVPPMLGGLLLLLDGGPGAVRRCALAGALFGAAAALKYSNAIFALAAFPLVLAVPGLSRGARLRACLTYIAGGAIAVGVLAGPWLALMYRDFGNPVFPLLNNWFRSPYAPAVNVLSARFALDDWQAALSFPFRMAVLDRALYSEMFAPDIRFAALAVAAVALAAAAAMGRAAASRALQGSDWRCFAFLGTGMALWLATSVNARYGMILLLLAGVCLVRLVERLMPATAARIAIVVALAVQISTSVLASPPRWFITDEWSGHWLPYAVPERALREPALYLSLETLSMSALAPFVDPASSFVAFRGPSSIPPDSPKLGELLERYRGRVRALGRNLELVDGKPRAAVVKAYDDTLLRIGFRLDTGDCFTIPWRPDAVDPLSRAANWLARAQPTNEQLSAVSCALRSGTGDPVRAERERYFSALFDRIEKACPRIFRGQTAVTEPFGTGWSRNYVGLDARLEAGGDWVVLNRYRAGAYVDLGRNLDWEKGTVPAVCSDVGPGPR
jgi:hypothetical protein